MFTASLSHVVLAYAAAMPSPPTLHCICRYQITYTVVGADGVAATPLTLSITFVEVAVVTGSFLLIGQAPDASVAQQRALQLNTTGSAPNAALTTAVANVFQTWLASATSSYVKELTATLGTTAANIAASNTLQLGQFSSVTMQDVTVANVAIDPNVTAVLKTESSADGQNYAYNVTLQVTVLTADMLVSVFVDELSNSSGSKRRLLLSRSGAGTDNLSTASEQKRPADAAVQHKVTCQFAGGGLLPSLSPTGQLLLQQLGLETPQLLLPVGALTIEPHTASVSAQQTQHMQHTPPVLPYTSHVSALHRAGPIQSLLLRHLLQSTASTAVFPLSSLLLFKKDLLLAAFTSTSGCSTDTIAELFYQGSCFPDAVEAICGDNNGLADYSLNMALLATSNSSVPLLQVNAWLVLLYLRLPVVNRHGVQQMQCNPKVQSTLSVQCHCNSGCHYEYHFLCCHHCDCFVMPLLSPLSCSVSLLISTIIPIVCI